MTSLEILLTVLVGLLLTAVGLLLWWMLKLQKQTSLSFSSLLVSTVSQISQGETSRQSELVRLLDKSTVLLSTTDPLVFQSIQVMNQPDTPGIDYDPSDEAELERLGGKGDDVDGFERSLLADAGLEPDPNGDAYPVG